MVVVCCILLSHLQSNLTVVTTELKEALIERISSKDWLDATTKKRALDKANAIIEQLVYPRRIAPYSFLDGLYSSVRISTSCELLFVSCCCCLFLSFVVV